MEQLKQEEKKSKEMLDLKITAEQNLEETEEDYQEMHQRRMTNRDNLIARQKELSELRQKKKRLTVESADLLKNNDKLIEENKKIEDDNVKMQNTIMTLIQRIDVSTLLKEIDVEEMRHQANQNISMNEAFEDLIDKWESINKQKN